MKKGFSLIEVLLAVTLFILTISGVTTAVISSHLKSVQATQRLQQVWQTEQVYQFATANLAKIDFGTSYLATLDPFTISEKPENEDRFYQIDLVNHPEYTNLKQLTVTAAWNTHDTYSLTGLTK